MSKTTAEDSAKKKGGRPRILKTKVNIFNVRLLEEDNLDFAVTAYLMSTEKSTIVRDYIKGLIVQEKARDAQKFDEVKKRLVDILMAQGKLSAPQEEKGKRRSAKIDLTQVQKEQVSLRLPVEDNLEFSVATFILYKSKLELLVQAVKEIVAKVKAEDPAKFAEFTDKYRAINESCPKSRKSKNQSNPEKAQQ